LTNELDLYFRGINSADEFTKASKFWDNIKNADGTVNSAYGYLIFKEKNIHNVSQWEWAYNSLIQDKDSRQAILHFNKPNHQFSENKDFPCTLNMVFNIRENKLNATVMMRSSDIFTGLIYDIPFFTTIQKCMLLLLQNKYPDLEMGVYTHFSNSLHLYHRNMGTLIKSFKYPFFESNVPDVGFSPIDEKGNFKNYSHIFRNWIEKNK
jgi:thymidylate synthase